VAIPIPTSRPESTSRRGPNNGLLVQVKEKDGDFVFPDVMDWSPYTFDPEAWEFRYTPSELLGDRLP
jgi:hypothetical protein